VVWGRERGRERIKRAQEEAPTQYTQMTYEGEVIEEERENEGRKRERGRGRGWERWKKRRWLVSGRWVWIIVSGGGGEERRGEEESGLDWVIVGWSGPGSQVNSPSSSEAHLG
jgi:hypothetical protein